MQKLDLALWSSLSVDQIQLINVPAIVVLSFGDRLDGCLSKSVNKIGCLGGIASRQKMIADPIYLMTDASVQRKWGKNQNGESFVALTIMFRLMDNLDLKLSCSAIVAAFSAAGSPIVHQADVVSIPGTGIRRGGRDRWDSQSLWDSTTRTLPSLSPATSSPNPSFWRFHH